MKDLRQNLKGLTGYERVWFGALLAGIMLSTLFFAHFILTRPFLLQKRTLNCSEAVGSLLRAQEVRAETPCRIVLSGVSIGDVPAAQLELTFEPRFPGLIRLKRAQFSGAELRVDPVTGELNGKTIPLFLQKLRKSFPALLLPGSPEQPLSADGYLESGSRSRPFHFELCRQKEDLRLSFRSGSCSLDGTLNGKDETWSAVFSGSGSLLSPLTGALPEGTVLSGEADWRWDLFRRGKGPRQSILSGRFGGDGGTILLKGAALRFAPGSRIEFNCSGDGFSGFMSRGTLFSPRVEVQDLSFRSRQEGGLRFSGMALLDQLPGVRKGGLPRPVRTSGYLVPRTGTLHAEAVLPQVSPDIFIPLRSFLPGKNVPDKLFWSLDETNGRGTFRVECDFSLMRCGRSDTAEKAKLILQSRLHRTGSGYILPESRAELQARCFRTAFCELHDLSFSRTTRSGNAASEICAASARFDSGRAGTFTVRNGRIRFREKQGIFNGTLDAKELCQNTGGEEWIARDPVLSFRYLPRTGGLSLAGRLSALSRKSSSMPPLQAQDCAIELTYGKTGWDGTLQAGAVQRRTGTVPLDLRHVQLRRAAGLVLLRAQTVSGRWRETDFTGSDFQLRAPGNFRCSKLHFRLAQAWEGKIASLEVLPGTLRCSGGTLTSTAQKKGEELSLSRMELNLNGPAGTLRIERIDAPGNWHGNARLHAERTAAGLRFFGPLSAAGSNDALMLSGDLRLAEQGTERLRAAFRRAPRVLPAPLTLIPSADRSAVLIVKGRAGISGEYRFADRRFSGNVTYQLTDSSLAMEQGYIQLNGVKTELSTDFASGRIKSGRIPLRFSSGILGRVLHVGAGEAKLQIRGHGLALRDLQTMTMGGTLQSENPLECNGTPYHQMYFKAATIRPAELAGGGFALRCDGTFRIGNREFGCTLKGGSGHIRLASLAPFASQKKSTLHDFVQAALVNFRAKLLQLDYLGRADSSGRMHIFCTGSPEKPLPYAFDEVRQKFTPLEPGEPGFLGEIDLTVDYTFPPGSGTVQK